MCTWYSGTVTYMCTCRGRQRSSTVNTLVCHYMWYIFLSWHLVTKVCQWKRHSWWRNAILTSLPCICNAVLPRSSFLDIQKNMIDLSVIQHKTIIVKCTESGLLPLRHHGTRAVAPHTKNYRSIDRHDRRSQHAYCFLQVTTTYPVSMWWRHSVSVCITHTPHVTYTIHRIHDTMLYIGLTVGYFLEKHLLCNWQCIRLIYHHGSDIEKKCGLFHLQTRD